MIGKNLSIFRKDFSVGFFLAFRDIKRGNPWTTALIIFVMTLTFFNMLLLGGILLGLREGVVLSFKEFYSSDILITPADRKSSIEKTDVLNSVVTSLPNYKASTNRLLGSAIIENREQIKVRKTDVPESAAGTLVGIDPIKENQVTHLSKQMIEGSYLDSTDSDAVLLGQNLLDKYARGPSSTETASKKLKDISIGSKLRLTVNGKQKDVFVKGIVGTDNANVDQRIFMIDSTARSLLDKKNINTNEIAVLLSPGTSEEQAKKYITNNFENKQDIVVETAAEALPAATADIKETFSLLGNMVGALALIVGAVTIFIVIFVNAITRRKFIGILKGIGITSRAIQISYVLQALFYAVSGIVIGGIIIMTVLKPYFDLHPINFPIAQGRLAVEMSDIIIRGLILSFTTVLSGFVPAWLITKQNTLDAILGR